jgi:Arc/MetJ-type ribon-helix-helix transcriptional regulator
MNAKRVLVHFDEDSEALYNYVASQKNKSEFIRACIKAYMEKESDLKNEIKQAVKEALSEFETEKRRTPHIQDVEKRHGESEKEKLSAALSKAVESEKLGDVFGIFETY